MVSPSQFEIRCELVEDTARLRVSGELDIATAPNLEEEVQALLALAIRHLVIDISRLSFIDSSGLSLLIGLADRATHEGWELHLTRPADPALSIFRISGADENLPFVDDEHPA